MAEDRPFPPSPRRIALARRAGLTATSPLLVGAASCTAVALVLASSGAAIGDRLRAMIVAAVDGAANVGGAVDASGMANAGSALGAIVDLALPIIVTLAVAALAAHLAQTRTLWIPRRKLDDGPTLEAGAAVRMRAAGFEIVAALTIGAIAIGWLWWAAPRLAVLPELAVVEGSADASLVGEPSTMRGATALGLSALAAIAIGWLAIGVLDALFRHLAIARALRMTSRERREDARLAAADPRWRDLRATLAREPAARELLRDATLLLVGDDRAVAIAFDPIRRPIPERTATGRGIQATQLLALARRDRIAIHRDPSLAMVLGSGAGPVPEAHWPRLAEIVAATTR